MYSYKEIISLPVLSLYEGELLGVVDKLLFDKKLKKLVEITLVGEDGLKFSLQTKNIYRIGKNAITIKNNQCIELKVENENLITAPIGSKAYSIQGEFLGVIHNIIINEKFLTTQIELENQKSLNSNLVASSGKNTIISFNKTRNANIKQFFPHKQEEDVKIEENKIEQAPTSNEVKEKPNKQKTNFSSDFLLGRICTKDIFNFNNEILIKAHSTITKKNLKEVIKFGKIRELMLFSK